LTQEEREAYLSFLRERREAVLSRASAACARSGRRLEDIDVIAVSKTVGVDEVVLAWQAGYRAFGENRPQELKRKLEGLAGRGDVAGARFDMIGNLQVNKINQVLGNVRLIHSVSSVHLAEAISKRAQVRDMVASVLVEVNVSGEESKSGLSPKEAKAEFEALLGLPGIDVCGLMTMAPKGDAERAMSTFAGLHELRDDLAGE
jgi:pyridoxal phosphate enzyme (YggS family)